MKLYLVLAHVSASYPNLTGRLPTCYSPIRRSFHKRPPEGFSLLPALDLHVLGTPPAFVLSQDQTLHKSSKHMTDESSSYGHLSFYIFLVMSDFRETFACLSLYWLFYSVFKEQIFCRSNWRLFKYNTHEKPCQQFIESISCYLKTCREIIQRMFVLQIAT